MREKHRIRERLLKNGVQSLSDTELVALLLRTGTAKKTVMQLAEDCIKAMDTGTAGSIEAVLHRIDGIGQAKPAAVLAAFELGRRYYSGMTEKIQTPADIVPLLRHYAVRKQEQFICISLNGAHEITAIRAVSVGTLTRTLVHPREVFADPLADRAAAVILAHNHPSGCVEPSGEDIHLTHRLVQAGTLLGIPVLDHIILAPNGAYLSFLEAGFPLSQQPLHSARADRAGAGVTALRGAVPL